jgi:hypothetical protein
VPGQFEYVNSLSANFPIAVALGPLAYIVLLRRRPWLGLYLLLWFSVPFLIHSLFLPFRQERYLLLAMPAVFAAMGIAAAWGCDSLHRDLKFAFTKWFARAGTGNALAGTIVVLTTACVLAPSALHAVKLVRRQVLEGAVRNDWDRVQQVISTTPELTDLPVGSAHSLPTLFYLGRVGFALRVGLLERQATRAEWLQTGNGLGWSPDGTPDYYGGVPVFRSPSALRAAFREAEGVLILMEDRDLNSASGWRLSPEFRQLIRAEAHELCGQNCGSLRLYHWQFEADSVVGERATWH